MAVSTESLNTLEKVVQNTIHQNSTRRNFAHDPEFSKGLMMNNGRENTAAWKTSEKKYDQASGKFQENPVYCFGDNAIKAEVRLLPTETGVKANISIVENTNITNRWPKNDIAGTKGRLKEAVLCAFSTRQENLLGKEMSREAGKERFSINISNEAIQAAAQEKGIKTISDIKLPELAAGVAPGVSVQKAVPPVVNTAQPRSKQQILSQ